MTGVNVIYGVRSLGESDLLSGVCVSPAIPINTENLFDVPTFTDALLMSGASAVVGFCRSSF